ncbi:unnamed protein product [Amoebophrya sp. A120]|nr:unnamed protein product [Amoebophrya sp. A120]|eukprot:GSA120T00018955001.1
MSKILGPLLRDVPEDGIDSPAAGATAALPVTQEEPEQPQSAGTQTGPVVPPEEAADSGSGTSEYEAEVAETSSTGDQSGTAKSGAQSTDTLETTQGAEQATPDPAAASVAPPKAASNLGPVADKRGKQFFGVDLLATTKNEEPQAKKQPVAVEAEDWTSDSDDFNYEGNTNRKADRARRAGAKEKTTAQEETVPNTQANPSSPSSSSPPRKLEPLATKKEGENTPASSSPTSPSVAMSPSPLPFRIRSVRQGGKEKLNTAGEEAASSPGPESAQEKSTGLAIPTEASSEKKKEEDAGGINDALFRMFGSGGADAESSSTSPAATTPSPDRDNISKLKNETASDELQLPAEATAGGAPSTAEPSSATKTEKSTAVKSAEDETVEVADTTTLHQDEEIKAPADAAAADDGVDLQSGVTPVNYGGAIRGGETAVSASSSEYVIELDSNFTLESRPLEEIPAALSARTGGSGSARRPAPPPVPPNARGPVPPPPPPPPLPKSLPNANATEPPDGNITVVMGVENNINGKPDSKQSAPAGSSSSEYVYEVSLTEEDGDSYSNSESVAGAQTTPKPPAAPAAGESSKPDADHAADDGGFVFRLRPEDEEEEEDSFDASASVSLPVDKDRDIATIQKLVADGNNTPPEVEPVLSEKAESDASPAALVKQDAEIIQNIVDDAAASASPGAKTEKSSEASPVPRIKSSLDSPTSPFGPPKSKLADEEEEEEDEKPVNTRSPRMPEFEKKGAAIVFDGEGVTGGDPLQLFDKTADAAAKPQTQWRSLGLEFLSGDATPPTNKASDGGGTAPPSGPPSERGGAPSSATSSRSPSRRGSDPKAGALVPPSKSSKWNPNGSTTPPPPLPPFRGASLKVETSPPDASTSTHFGASSSTISAKAKAFAIDTPVFGASPLGSPQPLVPKPKPQYVVARTNSALEDVSPSGSGRNDPLAGRNNAPSGSDEPERSGYEQQRSGRNNKTRGRSSSCSVSKCGGVDITTDAVLSDPGTLLASRAALLDSSLSMELSALTAHPLFHGSPNARAGTFGAASSSVTPIYQSHDGFSGIVAGLRSPNGGLLNESGSTSMLDATQQGLKLEPFVPAQHGNNNYSASFNTSPNRSGFAPASRTMSSRYSRDGHSQSSRTLSVLEATEQFDHYKSARSGALRPPNLSDLQWRFSALQRRCNYSSAASSASGTTASTIKQPREDASQIFRRRLESATSFR